MKKTLLISLGIVLLLFSVTLFLPKTTNVEDLEDYPIWIEMMEQPSVNMADARKAFDAYWSHHTHFKGDRSKQFEQWYNINARRLDQYGNVISATQVRDEFQRMRSAFAFEQKGQWFNYGPINVGPRDGIKKDGGRVKDIEFHPTNADTYYVSCFKSGLFKTTDAGTSWTALTDNLPQDVRISKVVPSTPSTIFIGTDTGVLKSTDDGLNWSSNISGLPANTTNALLIKPDNENIILAGNQSGIYRSINGGTSFALVQSTSNVEELRVHPTNPNIMYAGTNGATSQFFRSTDGGVTWTQNTSFGQGAFMKIGVTPAQPNIVFVINSRDHIGDDSFEGVYKSIDSGATFTKQSGGTPCITGYNDTGAISRGQPNYNLFIVIDPNDANVVYAGGVKSWKSIDGGLTWTQIFNDVTADGGGLHLDQLTWAYSPLNDKLFAVNDGGIYFLNSNNKFQTITDGLSIAEVWECTQSRQHKTNVAGGTFHCGIKLNKDGTWLSPWGGDEATVLFDYSDDTYAYHFKYEKISRSVDGGMSFQRINSSSADRGWYTGTGLVDKSDVNTLFVGLFEVERTQNAREVNPTSVTWAKISSFGGTNRIEKIEQAESNHNILYVSREGNKFYRSDNVRDESPVFIEITDNLPASGKVTDIATHPTDDNIVYILQGSQIFKSSNKGSSWSNISNGLPGVALLEMVYDNSSNEGIYIGTDIGVYYKDASMSSWIDYSNGLPVIRVSGMDIYYGANRDDSVLTVGTDGRGFWRSALNDVIVNVPNANFTASSTNALFGASISFTDTSTNYPALHEWTFEGGEPATSLDVNPVITYNAPGTYSVTLKVTNSAGNNTKTLNNYITISEGSDLQGHYKFDGNILDSSGYARHLTSVNYPAALVFENDHNALASSAITTPGLGSYLYNTNNFSITGNMARTVTAWIKTSVKAYQGIVSMGGLGTRAKYSVIIDASGRIRTEVSGSGHNDTAVIADGIWHHVASVYDGAGTNVLYVDGNAVKTSTAFGTLVTAETPLLVASEKFNASARSFQGALDDVRVYSRALTAGEITTVVNGGSLSIQDDLKKNKILAYPNPFTDRLTLKLLKPETAKMTIYNSHGQVFKIIHLKNKSKTIDIDTRNMPSGFYFVSVNNSILKIIKI